MSDASECEVCESECMRYMSDVSECKVCEDECMVCVSDVSECAVCETYSHKKKELNKLKTQNDK